MRGTGYNTGKQTLVTGGGIGGVLASSQAQEDYKMVGLYLFDTNFVYLL